MLNTTILSLNVLSLMSASPFYTLYHTHQGMLRSTFTNSHFSRSFTSVIVSYTYKHHTHLHNNVFSHTLNSAIMFTNDESVTGQCTLIENEDFIKGSQIKDKNIYGDRFTDAFDRPIFNNECGDIIITHCEFHNCHSDKEGGSLHIQQDCTVLIHNTIFSNSSSGSYFGGAAYIVKKKKTEDGKVDFIDEKLSQVDIQYCCFQDCYGTTENLYGVALLIAGENTILYYASTVNCPGVNTGRSISHGAQFDIQSVNVTSQYVNATGGYSKYCAGMEYRDSTDGFFRFQTISDMTCTFSIAFTNITITLDLSNSNIFNITLHRLTEDDGQPFSGLIHVRQSDSIKLEEFCFVNISFNEENKDNSRIISKGKDQSIGVTLINCTYDCDDERIEFNYKSENPSLSLEGCVSNTVTLNDIPQLNLGECQGKVTPAPLEPPTEMFSKSGVFTKSDHFTLSSHFTKSNDFTSSENVPVFVPKEANKGNKNVGMVAGIVAAVAAAAVIAALAAFFLIRKKKLNMAGEEEVETITDSTNSISNVNPIYDNDAADDPFKEDF